MNTYSSESFPPLLQAAVQVRLPMFDTEHHSALRLFNGFLEGCPNLAIDLYGRTLVLHNYADPPEAATEIVNTSREFFLKSFPWLEAILLKIHRSHINNERRGNLIYGEKPAKETTEYGVRYALDLTMNQDTSFYLDTRNLRHWLLENMAGKTLLNTFAYTGSLGVAARAGEAQRVVQTDINRKFLNLAKTSYTLNGFSIDKSDFMATDFFQAIGRFKSTKTLFDSVILDPPFFSSTTAGKVDLVYESHRLINKVRPLIAHNGYLITINNALFLKGTDYMQTLEGLCADGYMQIEEMIPVPEDITGFPATRRSSQPTDPAPFNHSTKICILRVTRKTG
jgi:23S rRNA (cytosine1962-C5)-methyltransferase